MKLTAQIEYAYWALLDIAERYDPNTTVNLNEISKRNGIPEKYLLQVMLKLKKQGLVRSRRGSGGGFQLTKSPDKIDLADVVRILGGAQQEIHTAFKGSSNGKPPHPRCAFFDIWKSGHNAFFNELKGFDLETLLKKEKRAKSRKRK